MAAIMTDRVTIRIGEKDFFTTRQTLAPSKFFTTLWSLSPAEQTEFFVDADPALFEHILRYLRTRMFPLFYDPVKGFDKCLYFALRQQAQFYGIDTLEMWISQEQYIDAVESKARVGCKTMCGEMQIQEFFRNVRGRGENLLVVSSKLKTEKRWKCPNGKWQHYGDRNGCWKAKCFQKVYHDHLTEMPVLQATVMLTSTNIQAELCLPVGPPPEEPPPYVPET